MNCVLKYFYQKYQPEYSDSMMAISEWNDEGQGNIIPGLLYKNKLEWQQFQKRN